MINNNIAKQKAIELGWSKTELFFGQKEINTIPTILDADETLEYLVQGTYLKKQGILFCTNKRISFIDKGFVYGIKMESFPLNQISSIAYGSGIIFGEIIISSTGRTVEKITDVFKEKAKAFAKYASERISNINNKQPKTPTSLSIADELTKLKSLNDVGVLSDEEFLKQKERLLS